MDHVPQSINNPHLPVQVPFVVTDKYEHIISNHESLRAEVNYDDDSGEVLLEISAGDGITTTTSTTSSSGSSDTVSTQTIQGEDEILNFYQARCFFGLLWDVYCLAGKQVEFDTGRYVSRHDDGRAVVSTEALLAVLEGIAAKDKCLSDEAKMEKYMELEKILRPAQDLTGEMLVYVMERWESLTVENDDEVVEDTSRQELWELQVIVESAAMLSETILNAARQMYLPSGSESSSIVEPIWGRDLPPAPRTTFLMERFRKAGWCPRQVVEASETAQGSRSVLFSLSSIDKRAALHGNHDRCCVESCVLESIDNDSYQPLHDSDCGSTNCPLVPEVRKSLPSDASTIISHLIRKGLIPVISVVEQPGSTPLLRIQAYQPGHKRDGPALGKISNKPEMDRMDSLVKLCHLDPKDQPREERKRKRAPTASDTKTSLRSLGDMARLIQPEDADDACLQYVAISHVWAHGLGNRQVNAIPLCQLWRLQRFVNLLVPEHLQPMPFWIDTLCVPLDPGTRSTAIKEMRNVYRDALAVLVIDRTLTELDLSNVETQECGDSGMTNWQLELLMRIKASPWAQRLWTYHESWLAKDLYFQISEKDIPAIHSQDIVVPRPQRTFNPFNQREQEQETERQLELIKALETDSKENMALLLEPEVAMLPLEYTAAYLLLEAGALLLFGKFPSEDGPHGFHTDVRDLSRQLALRTTSRPQDEAICLSALLGLQAGAVMTNAHGKAVPDEDRMKRLWELLGPDVIPAEILFCNRPIYGDHGCGWMPKSLLRADRGTFINNMRCGQALEKHADHGILVEMSGVGFEMPESTGPVVSLWNIALKIAGHKYRLTEFEASVPMHDWRSSVSSGKFAVLMPQNELRKLTENVEERVGEPGSHPNDFPFGMLANVLESPILQDESPQENVCYVLRREMVEFQILFDYEVHNEIDVEGRFSSAESDEVNDDESGVSLGGKHFVPVEAQVFHRENSRWWVG